MEHTIRVRQPVETFLANLRLRVASWRETGFTAVFLDLQDVDFMDSMAVGQIVRLHIHCKNEKIRLTAYNIRPDVKRSLIHSGVQDLLGVHQSAPPPTFNSESTV